MFNPDVAGNGSSITVNSLTELADLISIILGEQTCPLVSVTILVYSIAVMISSHTNFSFIIYIQIW